MEKGGKLIIKPSLNRDALGEGGCEVAWDSSCRSDQDELLNPTVSREPNLYVRS